MTYRIAQDSEYVGNNYWRWSAWLEGEEAELDAVEEVIWLLHPTFQQSRVHATERSRKFRLDTAGWGTFLLRGEVVLKRGEKLLLKHDLRLETPEAAAPMGSAEPTHKERKPTVFLSYSAQDFRKAAKLREGLKKAGIEVLDQTRLSEGETWAADLQRMISQSDAVLGLVSEDEISPWVHAEMESAVRSEKPAFAVMSAESSSAGIPKSAQMIKMDDVGEIADMLGERSRRRV